VVSTWRLDWVPLAEILCRGIPVSVITLMTLLFIECCFVAHCDLVLRLGGSPRPTALVLEILAAEFTIHSKVGKHLLSVYARNSWMNEEQSINNATFT